MTALIIVTGAIGTMAQPGRVIGIGVEEVQPLTFRWAILQAVGGWVGGAILILLGLAALRRAATHLGLVAATSARFGRARDAIWIWGGGLCAFLLVATSCASRTGLIFGVLGDLLAPVIGAMLADRLGQRGDWAGPRGAYNLVGLVAWATGTTIALALEFALMTNQNLAWWTPPTSVVGLVTAGLLYRLLAAAGREPAAG